MAYLLDTNALSEFLKKSPNENVIGWFNESDEQSHYVSTLTIGEIYKGISKLLPSRRKDELAAWFEQVIGRYRDRLLPVGLETAKIWGDMQADLEGRGRPIPAIDSLLAATAIEHNPVIVTRNHNDFAGTGIEVLNLWRVEN